MDFATDSAFSALRSRRQWLTFLAVAAVALAAAHALDQGAWQHLRDTKVNERDWGRLLRSLGYLPTWIIVAGALWLHDHGDSARASRWAWRGGLVVLAPMVAGTLAEALKILVRRLRPTPEVFSYEWRPFSDEVFSTRGLGMPSSHVAVAFAGAAVLSRVFPRTWWLWYLLAVGCAVTRILALGHFLSDTVAAALLGYAVGAVLAHTGGFGKSLQREETLAQ